MSNHLVTVRKKNFLFTGRKLQQNQVQVREAIYHETNKKPWITKADPKENVKTYIEVSPDVIHTLLERCLPYWMCCNRFL